MRWYAGSLATRRRHVRPEAAYDVSITPEIVAIASRGAQNDLRADSWFWVVFTNARQSGQPARSSFWAPREAMATISGVLDTPCAASGRTRRRRVASEPSG